MITIDKNIPLPSKGGSKCKYPWATMEIDDSFLIEDKTVEECGGLVFAAKKRHKRNFTARNWYDEEGHIIGTRVWRTE